MTGRMRKNRPDGVNSNRWPSPSSIYWDAVFLSQCSEREACDWLKGRSVNYSGVTGTPETPPESHVLEYILYRRNLPLIDLALAEHGRSRSVLERVFRRASLSIRVVACGNPSLFHGKVLRASIFLDVISDRSKPITDRSRSILRHGSLAKTLDSPPDTGHVYFLLHHIVIRGSLAELRAICENPDMRSDFYAFLVGCWDGWGNSQFDPNCHVSSDRFKRVLFFLSKNPRISTPFEKSKSDDYDFEYHELHRKCWELAKIVPVEREWAYILSELYQNLYCLHHVFDDIEAVLNRWRPENESFDEIGISPFELIREVIAVKFLTPKTEMLKSDDPALRRAFYSTFDPERPYYETDRTEWREMNWAEWLARDKHCDSWLVFNENVWRSSLGRQKLESLLSEVSFRNYTYNNFRKLEGKYRRTNPEWFENEEAQERYDEPEPDRIGKLESAIQNLAAESAKRRAAAAIWFLIAALIGAFLGAAIW